MIIDRIRQDMSVIASDDCCVGFVNRLEDDDTLRITSVSAGYGYDHLIPLSWVSEVDKYVFLDKTSTYVSTNWQHPSLAAAGSSSPTPRGTRVGSAAALQPKAA